MGGASAPAKIRTVLRSTYSDCRMNKEALMDAGSEEAATTVIKPVKVVGLKPELSGQPVSNQPVQKHAKCARISPRVPRNKSWSASLE
jgi:hypothetical protein